mmetsp:Transcript_20226/g.40082  ORF Transcript_20226/g.40082 Transcript_20226/m.40082 type:complete len:184 (+) Transcript_20226:40-591(+)
MLKVTSHALIERHVQVLVAGAAGVGKTSLIKRIMTDLFTDGYERTLGAELYHIETKVDGETELLHVWDCGGQERLRPTVQSLYSDIKAALLVYDMTDTKSLSELLFWHNEILRACPEAVIMVVGNKADLGDSIKITEEDGKKQCAEWHVPHMKVSAKGPIGLANIFPSILKKIQDPSHDIKHS